MTRRLQDNNKARQRNKMMGLRGCTASTQPKTTHNKAKNFFFVHERTFVRRSTGKPVQQKLRPFSITTQYRAGLSLVEMLSNSLNICLIIFPADWHTKVRSFSKKKFSALET